MRSTLHTNQAVLDAASTMVLVSAAASRIRPADGKARIESSRVTTVVEWLYVAGLASNVLELPCGRHASLAERSEH